MWRAADGRIRLQRSVTLRGADNAEMRERIERFGGRIAPIKAPVASWRLLTSPAFRSCIDIGEISRHPETREQVFFSRTIDLGDPAHKHNRDDALVTILRALTHAIWPELTTNRESVPSGNIRFEASSTAVLDAPFAGLCCDGNWIRESWPEVVDHDGSMEFEAFLLKAFNVYGMRDDDEPPKPAARLLGSVPARLRLEIHMCRSMSGGYFEEMLAVISKYARSVLRP